MSLLGVSNFHYALLTADTAAALTYAAPVAIPGLAALDVKFDPDVAELYADNGLYESYRGSKKATVDAELAEIPPADLAAMLGRTRESTGISVNRSTVAPYVAVGYERLKANGKKRRVWLLKGLFGSPDEANKSKGESTAFSTEKITGDFAFPVYGAGTLMVFLDEDDPTYDATRFAAWFSSVTGTIDTTPPTVACVPIDTATGIAVDANIVLTFSEAINTSTLVIGESFLLQKDDGTMIAGAGAWSVGNTVYTFNPTPALSGSYLVTITGAVKDLAGNKLVAVSFNFATV